MFAAAYPVRVDGALDRHLSRWLWLVKRFLAIPHHVVLAFLWLAFAVLSVAPFYPPFRLDMGGADPAARSAWASRPNPATSSDGR